jgi:hypothetical protein
MSIESPTLADESGTEALNLGLDSMVKAHKDFPHQIGMTPLDEQTITQALFSPNEIAALLTLAVRRLATS